MGKGAKTAAQRPKTPSHLRSAPKGYANDPDAVARETQHEGRLWP